MLQQSPEGALIGRISNATAGSLIAVARNTLCERFLEGPEPWLLMCDTDLVADRGAVSVLAEAADEDKRPVVSAVVPVVDAHGDGVYGSCYDAERGEDGTVRQFRPMRDLPRHGLIQADGVGAACLLIHRSVLEQVRDMEGGRPAWFDHRRSPEGRIVGEDLSLCLRLMEAGIPIWVETELRLGHAKTVIARLP